MDNHSCSQSRLPGSTTRAHLCNQHPADRIWDIKLAPHQWRELFKVKVKAVNTLRQQGKVKRFRGIK
ncbi:MAG: hypothetical protein ACPGL0_03180, partial [Limisphaerales bacterium]